MKNFIITGSSSFVGRAIIKNLLEKNDQPIRILAVWRVSPVGVNHPSLKKIRIDLLKESDLKKLSEVAETYFEGEVFSVINCAGGLWEHKPFTAMSYKEVILNFQQNFITVLGVAYHLLPLMEKNKGGNFVVFGCNSTQYAYPFMAPFTAAKKALTMLMKSLRSEYGKNVCFNTFVLTTVDTPRERSFKPKGDFEKWLKPNQIAEIVCSFVSTNLLVNGAEIDLFNFSTQYYRTSYYDRISKK